MRSFRPLARAAGIALGVAAFLVCAVATAAEKGAPAKSGDGSSKVLLPPDMEAKLKSFIDKTKDEKIKRWNARMTKQIDAVAKVTGLDDAGKKALAGPAQQAVTAAIAAWEPQAIDLIRKEMLLMQPEQVAMILNQRMNQFSAFAQADWLPGAYVTVPFEEEVWTNALKQTLSPDQMTAWNKAEDDRKAAIEKQMADLLKTGADRIRQEQTQQILSECAGIEVAVGLSKDRSAKLEDMGKEVAGQTSEMWRKRVDKMLLSIDDSQRQQFIDNGNIFIGTEDDETPTKQAAWTDGLAHLLTADERARIKNADEARKAARAQVLGRMMIVLLDERIAFTAAQRQRLQPVADRLVSNSPGLFPPDQSDLENMSCSPVTFYAAAGSATDAELKPILDDVQLKRWRALAEPARASTPPDDGKTKPAPNAGPEDIEKAISLFLYQKAENERKRLFDLNVLKAEDIMRVAGVSAESAARLQAAARGATEEALSGWKWFTEQQVRAQLQEVTPQNIQQRLDGLEDYMFFQRNFGQANRQSLWDDTVKSVLTAPQQEAWKKETDARAAYGDAAIATMVVSNFEAGNEITPDQRTKLEQMVAKVVHDYGQDIDQIFSPNNPVPWYMQGSYSVLPIAGISDDDLKGVLTKQQIDRWHTSPDCGNISGLWTNIQQMHAQRQRTNQ